MKLFDACMFTAQRVLRPQNVVLYRLAQGESLPCGSAVVYLESTITQDTGQLTLSSRSLVRCTQPLTACGVTRRVYMNGDRVDCPAFICVAEDASEIQSIPGFMGHLSFPSRRRSHADVLSAQREARGEHWLLIGRLMMSIEDTQPQCSLVPRRLSSHKSDAFCVSAHIRLIVPLLGLYSALNWK
jgi:hypothetical protein